MVTIVPPDVEPMAGLSDDAVGTSMTVKPPGTVVLVPPEVVTLTAALPAEWAGAVKVSEVGEFTTTLAAGIMVPSNVTDASPGPKPVPVRVTLVPPESGPA
jgi:hypothetical protein